MDELVGFVGIVFLLILGVALILYILQGIFLTKFNKLVHGKGTPLAWIPIASDYLLGELTFNKPVGLILVIIMIITRSLTTLPYGIITTITLPEEVTITFSSIMFIVLIIIYICAFVKYNKLKKAKIFEHNNYSNQNQTVMNTQPIISNELTPIVVEQKNDESSEVL